MNLFSSLFGSKDDYSSKPVFVDKRNIARGRCTSSVMLVVDDEEEPLTEDEESNNANENSKEKKHEERYEEVDCECEQYERPKDPKEHLCAKCGHYPTDHDDKGIFDPSMMHKYVEKPLIMYVVIHHLHSTKVSDKLKRWKGEELVNVTDWSKISRQFGDPDVIKAEFFNEQYINMNGQMVLKLILTDISTDSYNPVRQIHDILSAKIAESSQVFGYLHTALQIDSLVLDWNNSGLVCIRPLKETLKRSVFALDVFGSMREFAFKYNDKIIDKICKVIVKYNAEKEYDTLKSNCQDFTLEVLKVLGVKSVEKYLGPYTLRYLDYLRVNGRNAKPVYKNHIGETREFATHAELDAYIWDLLKSEGARLTEDHLNLLKSFDRAFHFRNGSHPDDETTMPHPERGCPFGKATGQVA